jgi:hypothetical protein
LAAEEDVTEPTITVVDGQDGLTPEMLRKRKGFIPETAEERRRRWRTKDSEYYYFRDPMHE